MAWPGPACLAADSSARSVVVPTATTRPPAARVAAMAATVAVADLEPFAVHAVLGEVFGAHRLEGAGADVQRDGGACPRRARQRGQHGFVEVQRGRGRGHGAGAAANTVW